MNKTKAEQAVSLIDKKIHELNCEIFNGVEDGIAKKLHAEIEKLAQRKKKLMQKFGITQILDW